MTAKTNILRQLSQGKTVQDLEGTHSKKTLYKYLRLWLCIEIRNRINTVIDSDAWASLSVTKLRNMLEEVEKW